MIKAVTFDCWHTILNNDEEMEKLRLKYRIKSMLSIFKSKNINVLERELKKAIDDVNKKSSYIREKEWIEVTPEQQLTLILQKLSIKQDSLLHRELLEPYTKAALTFIPTLMSGVEEIIPKIANYMPIALICNTGVTPGRVIRQIFDYYDLSKYFITMVFSDEFGLAKPHPNIFREAMLYLKGIPCNNILHVGDDLFSDIKGGQSVGMKTVFLGDENQDDSKLESIKSLVDLEFIIFK
ncbi:HAD family hydrolase [Clostridium beijerinckii]|uniref:HAD family hydrolase n=1 Tax=Clostridium beijerinckii TaxID=1520 RepID=UPI00047DD022|nr:HAD family hydrolase [Clostridium beijerinckii]